MKLSKKKFNRKLKLSKKHKRKLKNQRGGAIVEYVEKKPLYENNRIVPFQQVVINKNGLVQDENILQDKINLITLKAFKYLQNAQLIRNELYLQELKK